MYDYSEEQKSSKTVSMQNAQRNVLERQIIIDSIVNESAYPKLLKL